MAKFQNLVSRCFAYNSILNFLYIYSYDHIDIAKSAIKPIHALSTIQPTNVMDFTHIEMLSQMDQSDNFLVVSKRFCWISIGTYQILSINNYYFQICSVYK